MKKRAMKKRIPWGIYCDRCPWWHLVWWDTTKAMEKNDGDFSMYINPSKAKKRFERMYYHPYKHKKEECQFKDSCGDNCDNCKEIVSHCRYLNYTEYGQYPLGDACKICNVKPDDNKRR